MYRWKLIPAVSESLNRKVVTFFRCPLTLSLSKGVTGRVFPLKWFDRLTMSGKWAPTLTPRAAYAWDSSRPCSPAGRVMRCAAWYVCGCFGISNALPSKSSPTVRIWIFGKSVCHRSEW